MNTCRTCKFWEAHPLCRDDTPYPRRCLRLADVLQIDIDQGHGYGGGGASLGDIDVPPDFGCLLHETVNPTAEQRAFQKAADDAIVELLELDQVDDKFRKDPARPLAASWSIWRTLTANPRG